MSSIVEREIQPMRVQIILLGTFAALAVGLASLGIYGVLSYAVTQRTREIGLRMALGAQRDQVLGMVMRRASALLLTGLIAGLAGGWMVSRLMASLLFEVNPGDPVTFGGATLVLAIVALFAAFLPARRAARVDPLVALRYE
jgi:putative ABC transport system permease protein